MLKDFSEFASLFSLVMFKGGWIGFAAALLYMFYKLYMDHIQIKWYRQQEWVFLKITVPKDTETSPLAFEQVLNQLHSIHMNITWAERYLEGQVQIWFTWEITSIGGVIGFYVKILKKHRDNLEAAVYSQYPKAEIAETEDYFENLPHYDPDTSDYDVFGFTYHLIKEKYYPIRTYYEFEHASADTFVDPLAGMWEELGKISPYEMVVIQYVMRPIGDDEWKKPGYELVQKLKGVPEAEGGGIFGKIGDFVLGPILDIFIRPGEVKAPARRQEKPPSLMLHLSEGEKNVIAAIERKLSKWGYKTKIHFLYVAPKEKYNPGPIRNAVIGSFKGFSADNLNSLKPLLSRWTRVNYFAFKNLEKPIVEFRVKWRKHHYVNFMRKRFYLLGPPGHIPILNVEELATIIHFPKMEVTVPQIQKVEVTKAQPPPELPIAL